MQNKKASATLWVILVIVLLVAGYFFLGGSDDTTTDTNTEDTGVNLEDAEDSDFENVESTDQILNEIDDSLNYFE